MFDVNTRKFCLLSESKRMKIFLGIILVVFSTFQSTFQYDPTIVRGTQGVPWPLPQQYLPTSTYFSINPSNFKFVTKGAVCDIITNAIQRYQNLTFPKACSALTNSYVKYYDPLYLGEITNITVFNFEDDCNKAMPALDMSEHYKLKVAQNQVLLFSNTAFGVLRGLETFSQIVYQLEDGTYVVNATSILDYPRFSYRGVLLDTSRHYISIPRILENLDLMAQSKFNVFHWHIVDDQSFPYVSKSFPDLHKKGAFNPTTHIYTQDDVANVIEYARLRGIRVIVEFDTPGHTLSWGKAIPSLLTTCFNGSTPLLNSFGPIDPTNDTNYDVLRTFFKEIASTFPDNYIHLGGDEVSFDCWKSNPIITNFMKMQKFGTDYSRLEQYYVQKLLDIIKTLGKNYIVWQEVFDNKVELQPDTVIHVWKGGYEEEMANVTAAGYKAILSSCWYLNEISYGVDWQKYYKCDPQNFNGTWTQKNLVEGGEACMWGEFIDGSNLITTLWPRASVVAERLWSDKNTTDIGNAQRRLEEHHCRLLKRGHRVANLNGPGFCGCDYKL